MNDELRAYVEREILPRYDYFDAAHRRDHDHMVYVKGAYNLMSCATTLANEQPSPHLISDWTLIAEGVAAVSSAPMGTVIKYSDGRSAYYGFELNINKNSEFGYKELSVKNADTVSANNLCIWLKDDSGNYYFWGYMVFSFILRFYEDNCQNSPRVFSDEPLLISFK